MTISETDLRLLQSERLTDFDNGGGQITGNSVVDGEVNNLFNDISQLDRTYGRVSLRKAFAGVQSDNADTYLGCHLIITDPADDPAVEVIMFDTNDWTDTRDNARNYVENYATAGPESGWIVYGNQIAGQRLLLLYSIANANNLSTPAANKTPEIGDQMMLSVEKSGYDANYQYVRITEIVSRETQQFNDGAGVFYKDVLTLKIRTALRYTFPGTYPIRIVLSRTHIDASPTLLRLTSIADAATYYGVKPVSNDVVINDLTVHVESPYSTLVPAALSETPLVDQSAGLTAQNYVQSGNADSLTGTAALSGNSGNNYAATLYLGRGIMPNTLSVIIGGVAYKDDALGGVVLASGALGTYSGFVDYASGGITLTRTVSWSASVIATATPAVAIADNSSSIAIEITANNRAFSYVLTLRPSPSPKALVIDYRAFGKWYRLTDDGAGRIAGEEEGIGSGSINYATGSVLLSLSALPDVDTAIIFAWSTPNRYQQQTNVIALPQPPAISKLLAYPPIKADTLDITWSGGFAHAATDGEIGGDATGRLINANGELTLYPNELPPSGTDFTVTYFQNVNSEDVFTVSADGNGVFTIQLTETPVEPGSVRLRFNIGIPRDDLYFAASGSVFQQTNNLVQVEATDDGAGTFAFDLNSTINYTTGVIVLKATKTTPVTKVIGFYNHGSAGAIGAIDVGIIETTEEQTFATNSIVTASYVTSGSVTTPRTETITLSELNIDLNTVSSHPFIANSLRVTAAGMEYIDRNGSLYINHSKTTDSAESAGSVNYESGIATLTQWPGGGVNSLTLQSAVVALGNNYVTNVSGHAPGSPLSTGQFQFIATTADGEELTASADNNGVIDSEWMTGFVDWQSSWYTIYFGKYVLDSTIPEDVKTNSGWYNADNIQLDGTIFVPRLVKPETMTFNAVLVSYIPLDADVLGLDTERLPLDGKVPVFRVGSVAVIHNTIRTTLVNPVVAGATYDMGRIRLAYAKLYDADNLPVPTDKYTADLDAGTITMANPLVLTGFTQPLVCEHRIEDMSLVSDVQVTGDITLMRRVTHDYPADTSFISSALIVGDLQARVSLLFDQFTWTGDWSNELIGDIASGTFNDALYPVVLTNKGSIQERWYFQFTGATSFNCYGEYSGLVGTGSTATEFAPINPATSAPYFVMNPLGWGGGWSVGNVLRMNTEGANTPVWLARTTLQSAPTVFTDHFKLQIRGDAN